MGSAFSLIPVREEYALPLYLRWYRWFVAEDDAPGAKNIANDAVVKLSCSWSMHQPPSELVPSASALAHRRWLVDPPDGLVIVVPIGSTNDEIACRWMTTPCLVELSLILHGSSLCYQADHQAAHHLVVEVLPDEDELHRPALLDHARDVVRENSSANHLVDGPRPLGNGGFRHHHNQ